MIKDVEDIRKMVAVEVDPDEYHRKTYPMGHQFYRMGLTLSSKGWTASVEWDGMVGARGKGATQVEAINNAILYAEKEYGVKIYDQKFVGFRM
jgi:hypothetical protein